MSYASEVLADSPLAYYRLGDVGAGYSVVAATASSNFFSEPPGGAFDGSSDSGWTSGNTPTGWLQAQLSSAQALTSYSIARRDSFPARNPVDWTFKGSNDGTTWTTLDTRTGISWPTAGETKFFTFTNTTAYLYYRLDVTANGGDAYLSVAELGLHPMLDSSGNARHGNYVGNVAPTGRLINDDANGAAVFGIGRGEVPYASWLSVTNLTAEAVIVAPTTYGYRDIVTRDQGSSPRFWNFRVDNTNRLQLLLWTNLGLLNVIAPTQMVGGTVYHVAATYDGANVRIYLNGVLDITTAHTGVMTSGTLSLSVGATAGGLYEFFEGTIDEVAVYGAALSGARIAAHSAAALADPTTTYPNRVLADSPLAYWRLDETSGTTAADASGNAHPGTYSGSVTLAASALIASSDRCIDVVPSGQVSTPDAAWLRVPRMSAEAWVNPDNVTGVHLVAARVDFDSAAGAPYSWAMGIQDGKFYYGVRAAGTSLFGSSAAAPMVVGTRYHMVMTYDGLVIRLYLNGVLKDTIALAGTMEPGNQALRVGRGFVTRDYYDGRVDEFAFYGTALSSRRVAAHYALADTVPVADPSLSLAGAVPAPVLAASLTVADGPVGVSLAGVLAPPTPAFLIGVGDVAGLLLAGAVAPPTGAFTLDLGVAPSLGVTGNRFGGRDRDGIGEGFWEPPVEEPPNKNPIIGRVVAHAFSDPVITRGVPRYSVESASRRAHRDRIVIGGRDVTYFRGVPTPFPGFSLIEPFMYGPTSITFPQIAAAFEAPGDAGLRWLKKFAPVVIQRVNADDEVVSTDYRGIVIGYDALGGSLTVQIGGELTGRAAMQNRQVPLFPIIRDLGAFADVAVRQLGLGFTPYGGPETGVRAESWGGGSMLEYLNQIVAMSWTRTGNRWTIMPTAKGTYRMTRKDRDTIHGTVYADDTRTIANLTRDLSEEPNRIFMQGTTPRGQRVRFGAYPGLKQGEAPRYPYDNTSIEFGPGTENSDTDTGDGVTVLITRLRTMEYLDPDESQNGYNAAVARAVRAVQRDAGILPTGEVDLGTWRALFDLSMTGFSLRWSRILPAAEIAKVRPWNRSSSGAIIGRNPRYDRTYAKVDRNVDAGAGWTRAQLREWAQATLEDTGENDWVGSITFSTGAIVQGIHLPGQPITEADVLRTRDLRPGMNLWLPLFAGGIVVHISSVGPNADGTVVATVDTRARDALEVWEVMERNRESRVSPYRQWLADHRASTVTKDAVTPWDEVGGQILSDVNLVGDKWTVIPVVAGQEGTVARLRMKTSIPAEYCVAIFGSKVGPGQLRRIVGNPLTLEGRKNWKRQTKRGLLDGEVLLYVAGDVEAPCGYFPRTKPPEPDPTDVEEGEESPGAEPYPETAPLTGRWEDDASFGYRTDQEPVLYMAIWVDRDCTLPAGRVMWNQLEAGA